MGQWINIDNRNSGLSVQGLLTSLPGSFSLYKPDNSLTSKKLIEKTKKGEAIYSIKRDGEAFIVVVDYYGNINFYSRRGRPWHHLEGPKELLDGTLDFSAVVPWSARFGYLIEAIKGLGLPPGSMMACELVFTGKNGDDFNYVSSITRSLTPKALEDMEKYGYPILYWWDIPFFSGQDLFKDFTRIRYELIWQLWSNSESISKKFIQPIQRLNFKSTSAAIDHAKANNLEGWVVIDPEGIYGDKGYNIKGKPDRPGTFCAKLKPKHEDDFVVLWDPDNKVGQWGKGKHEGGKVVTLPTGEQAVHGGVGSLALFQYNNSGQLVYICDCASGMDYAFQAKLRPDDFPFVAQIEYAERTYMSDGDKTNALKFPVFVRVRHDKKIRECFNEKL